MLVCLQREKKPGPHTSYYPKPPRQVEKSSLRCSKQTCLCRSPQNSSSPAKRYTTHVCLSPQPSKQPNTTIDLRPMKQGGKQKSKRLNSFLTKEKYSQSKASRYPILSAKSLKSSYLKKTHKNQTRISRLTTMHNAISNPPLIFKERQREVINHNRENLFKRIPRRVAHRGGDMLFTSWASSRSGWPFH